MTSSTRRHRISELMLRYRPQPGVNGHGYAAFRVLDRETGATLPDAYSTEDMARAAARLQAAADIEALFAESEGR